MWAARVFVRGQTLANRTKSGPTFFDTRNICLNCCSFKLKTRPKQLFGLAPLDILRSVCPRLVYVVVAKNLPWVTTLVGSGLTRKISLTSGANTLAYLAQTLATTSMNVLKTLLQIESLVRNPALLSRLEELTDKTVAVTGLNLASLRSQDH